MDGRPEEHLYLPPAESEAVPASGRVRNLIVCGHLNTVSQSQQPEKGNTFFKRENLIACSLRNLS